MAIQVDDEIAAHVAEWQSKRLCLGCDNKVPEGSRYVRGNCEHCYAAAWRVQNKGKRTESQLVKAGLLTQRGPSGRKATSQMSKRIAEMIPSRK